MTNRKFHVKGKKPEQLKTKLLEATGAKDEGIIDKIWTDINPTTYLRPEPPKVRLPRLLKDLQSGKVFLDKEADKWKVKTEASWQKPPNDQKLKHLDRKLQKGQKDKMETD